MIMSPSLSFLLTHYRQALADSVTRLHGRGLPPCPAGEESLWAEAGEGAGWLSAEEGMEIRRLAFRVRFYEQRARSLVAS